MPTSNMLRVAGRHALLQCNVSSGARRVSCSIGKVVAGVTATSSSAPPCRSSPNNAGAASRHSTFHTATASFQPRRSSPIASAWLNSRSCSSHASSSLVKMASDRDILSDEYVRVYCIFMLRAQSLLILLPRQCQAYQLRHLSLRPPAQCALDIPGSRSN